MAQCAVPHCIPLQIALALYRIPPNQPLLDATNSTIFNSDLNPRDGSTGASPRSHLNKRPCTRTGMWLQGLATPLTSCPRVGSGSSRGQRAGFSSTFTAIGTFSTLQRNASLWPMLSVRR